MFLDSQNVPNTQTFYIVWQHIFTKNPVGFAICRYLICLPFCRFIWIWLFGTLSRVQRQGIPFFSRLTVRMQVYILSFRAKSNGNVFYLFIRFLKVLRAMRLIRLFRIFKLGRYSQGMKLMVFIVLQGHGTIEIILVNGFRIVFEIRTIIMDSKNWRQ